MISAIQLDLLNDVTTVADETIPAHGAIPMPALGNAAPGHMAAEPQPNRFAPDALDLLIALAPVGEARPTTLAGCLALLASRTPQPKWLLRDATSAVSSLAKKLDTDAASLPADPSLLRAILTDVTWAALGRTRKTESNVRTAIQGLLLASGWVMPEFRAKARHTPDWHQLVDKALPHKLNGPIGPFARYCSCRGIGPFQVRNADLIGYWEARTTGSTDLKPRQSAIQVSTAWNRMQENDPTWPRVQLGLESKVCRKAARVEEMPRSFQDELEAYMQSLRHPDPLDPESGRPVRELTVQHARRAVLRAAAYLAQTGIALDDMPTLSRLVDPASFKALLLVAYRDGGDTWTDSASNIAKDLAVMARKWVRPTPDVLAEINRMRRMAKKKRQGLSRAVRERIGHLEDKAVLKALFALPEQSFAEADRMRRDGRREQAAKLHEVGLMLAILLTQPIRRKDLARIDMEENLVFDKKKRLERIIIDVGVKNTVMVEIPLSGEMADHIKRHVAVFRPYISGHDKGTALFPGPSGKSLSPESTGRRLTNLVERQLGAHMTPHDARHLAVTLLLDHDPANMVVAQRLLGHTTPKTTAAIYGTARTAAAQKAYAGIVDELRGKAKAKEQARQRRIRWKDINGGAAR